MWASKPYFRKIVNFFPFGSYYDFFKIRHDFWKSRTRLFQRANSLSKVCWIFEKDFRWLRNLKSLLYYSSLIKKGEIFWFFNPIRFIIICSQDYIYLKTYIKGNFCCNTFVFHLYLLQISCNIQQHFAHLSNDLNPYRQLLTLKLFMNWVTHTLPNFHPLTFNFLNMKLS